MEDEKILAGIQQNEAAAFNILYKFYYPAVRNFVLKNNGSEADAEDVFQETLIVLLHKVPKDDFELTSSLKTYIFSIASNIWLKKLRDVKRQTNHLMQDMAEIHSAKEHEAVEIQKQTLLNRALAAITDHCLTLIYQVFYTDKRREEIMAEMRYKNPHTFNNQKYKCLQQAKKAAVRK
ncbi:MAG TPA: sigma-70 family RNA polymerase sigma factor [Flavipsychrobacter sp.]